MMKKIMLFVMFIILSLFLVSCVPRPGGAPGSGEATGVGLKVNDITYLSNLDLDRYYGAVDYHAKTGNQVCRDFRYSACVMEFALYSQDNYGSTTGVCGGAGGGFESRDTRYDPLPCSTSPPLSNGCYANNAGTGKDYYIQAFLWGVLCVK